MIENVITQTVTHDLVFGRIHTLAHALGWTTPPTTSFPPKVAPETLSSAFEQISTQLQHLRRSLPARTALIMYTGCSDPRRMGYLNQRKSKWESKVRAGIMNDSMPEEQRWTNKDAEDLEKEVERVKAGLAFFCVTMATKPHR